MRRSSARPAAVALAVLALLTAVAAPAWSAPGAREQREEARRKRADVAADVDVLEADAGEVEQALAVLDAEVQARESALAAARQAVADAEHALAEARAAEQATLTRLDQLHQAMADLAVRVYMRPPTEDTMAVLRSGDVGEAARRKALLDVRTDSYVSLNDELEAAQEDLAIQRADAERAAQEATLRREEAAGELVRVEQAQADQQRLADELNARLDARLAEAAALEALDAQLSSRIAAEEAALAAAAARRRAAAAAPAASSGGGGGGVVVRSAGSLSTVNGITVASSIAGQLAQLLSAAAADGIHLSGGGYRDPSAQIAVRRNNCGTSDYAVYQMPSSQCSPPTAPPGRSMHEQGLAVDFTWNGSVISSRSSPAFRWLAANAGRYGLRNLPSEPWHWSTTGR